MLFCCTFLDFFRRLGDDVGFEIVAGGFFQSKVGDKKELPWIIRENLREIQMLKSFESCKNMKKETSNLYEMMF